MRKCAILDNNIIIEIALMDDVGYMQKASKHQLVIDIHDLAIQPQLNWVLTGNTLTPPANSLVSIMDLIKARVKHYQDGAPELLRDLYAENTLLGITVEQSNEMFNDFQDVLIRIREGAWPTALFCLSQKQPRGFVTQEMINKWYNLINSRIIQ